MTRPLAGSPRPLLSVRDLSTAITTPQGTARAVDRISFDLSAGRTLAIVGESGAGKSILARSLINLLPRAARISGRSGILFDNEEVTRMGSKDLNRIRGKKIGMVFQDPLSSLNPVMTVGSQIAESLVCHLGMGRAGAKRRAVELLDAVGIPGPGHRVRQYPHQLSGGMRQRVAIAIALACDPLLLIADEPTTALDVTVQAEILDLLARRQIEKKMAMILITHDLGVAAGRAHDIMVLYGGKIVEQAPAAELFARMRMPYTRALINAVPRIENRPHTKLNPIEGPLPNPADLPAGCSFSPRCPRAKDRCFHKEPLLTSDGSKRHLFACWYPEAGPEKGGDTP